jgi:hypothetical protein
MTLRQMELSGKLPAPATLTPNKEHVVPTGKEAGYMPELVWMLWRRKKIPVPTGN